LPTLTLPAPAKLNLFLHITGRRDDGYHHLQTVFQILDYSDEITLERHAERSIKRVKGLEQVPEESDLCVRAAKLLQKQCHSNYGVKISIEKRLPIGGGIGGGSSDAATVLQGLNQLWGCGLTSAQLAKLGLQLGADVPLFVEGYSAWAEGVGEVLTPVTLDEKWYLVIHPKVFVSTAELFADKSLTRDSETITIARFLESNRYKSDLVNVFEKIVRKKHPEIDESIKWLSQFSAARLTGTGSCVFAVFDEKELAQQVLDKLPKQWQGFVAKGVNKSPLLSSLA
jgi:4-diphosphocytidyl-2-C-methyl-D-erythritol kinase